MRKLLYICSLKLEVILWHADVVRVIRRRADQQYGLGIRHLGFNQIYLLKLHLLFPLELLAQGWTPIVFVKKDYAEKQLSVR